MGEIGVPLVSLPGVRRRLRRLRDDLVAGRSCLWLLPRTYAVGPDPVVDRLLAELLHEIGDFVLLPEARTGRHSGNAPQAPVQASAVKWSGLAPLLDYDDGMSGFGVSMPGAAAPPQAPPVCSVATPAESLAELLNRVAGELGQPAGPPCDHPDTTVDRFALLPVDGVLARLTGRAGTGVEMRPIIIKAWREQAPSTATGFLRRMAATVKEAGLPSAGRPRALVVATVEDLPADLPDQLDREDIAVHWWWGAIGRLDTATVVALNRPPTVGGQTDPRQVFEAVVQATIIELCGPFLDTAARVAASWTGNPETLTDVMREAAGEADVEDAALLGCRETVRGSTHRPSQPLLPMWSAGLVENWDGHVRSHPAGDLASRRTMTTRVWLAQHHALLPRLDDAREQFAEVVRRRTRIPLPQLADRYGSQPASAQNGRAAQAHVDALTAMELGSMWGAHLNGHISLARIERQRLQTLWLSRNLLAHRTPLDVDQLRRLIAELSS